MRRVGPGLFITVTLLVPASARAGNGIHPRTPVEWPEDTPCMTVIDRSQSATLHFPYTIPNEDTEITMDEVADSRRHQFVVFCRNHSPQAPLPVWLSWTDVDAAVAVGIAQKADYTDADVMETSDYQDCFFRITPDDQRRPITFAEADKGVDWDTTGLPAGPYIIQGYTWEPAFNIWRKRPGVVHVVDGPDLAAVPPAAAIMSKEDYLFGDDTLMIEGCARALPGSTLTGYWSLTGEGSESLDWKPFAENVPLEGDTISLPFTPPVDAIQETIALRVDVTDPMQRTFSAYPMELLVVLPPNGGSTTGCSDTGSFIGNESCGDSGDSTTASSDSGEDPTSSSSAGSTATAGPSTTTTSTTTSDGSATSGIPIDQPGDPGTCACRARHESGPAWLFAGLALLGLGRRRRRGDSH